MLTPPPREYICAETHSCTTSQDPYCCRRSHVSLSMNHDGVQVSRDVPLQQNIWVRGNRIIAGGFYLPCSNEKGSTRNKHLMGFLNLRWTERGSFRNDEEVEE